MARSELDGTRRNEAGPIWQAPGKGLGSRLEVKRGTHGPLSDARAGTGFWDPLDKACCMDHVHHHSLVHATSSPDLIASMGFQSPTNRREGGTM